MANERMRVAGYVWVPAKGGRPTRKMETLLSICNNPDWTYAGLYVDDERESKERAGLKRLVEDCRAGLIDMVYIRTISGAERTIRFGGNGRLHKFQMALQEGEGA